MDDLIRQIQARQRSATPTKQRTTIRREEEETVAGSDDAGGEASSARRQKKRGSGGHNKTQEGAAPSHLHLMYQEEDETHHRANKRTWKGRFPCLSLHWNDVEHDASSQRTLVGIGESLAGVDWRLLRWLLRYPLQRADDLMVGVARWGSRATVYRHVQAWKPKDWSKASCRKRREWGRGSTT